MRSYSKKKQQNNKLKSAGLKGLLIGISILILPLLATYLYFGDFYKDHFYSNTEINGVDTSNMTTTAAKDTIDKEVSEYILSLTGRNGLTDTITGEEIGLHTVLSQSLPELMEQQNSLGWPSSVFRSHKFKINTMLEFDEATLKEVIKGLIFFADENIIEPKNATISEYSEHGYEIVPEDNGAKVVEDKLYEAVLSAITTLQPSLSLEEAKSYSKPVITAKNEKLVKALEEMNRIAGSVITYEFGEDIEILDGSRINEWLTLEKDYTVTLDTTGVKEYVDYIGKTYNSFGRVREFQTSYDQVIQVSGGDYGWWLDRVSEVEELTELIKNGEQVKKEPVYFQTAQQYGKDDIGDTYVEVNLTAQHLFFYKEGELILESDFVSGNVSKNWATPVGTYPVQYKENDAVLVGEDYETPVKYWMPFNKNIGFHDAVWREEFGKDIFLTKGSHGCINMPPKAAKIMFKHIKRGVAVVVYELPGTENYEVIEEAEVDTDVNIDVNAEDNTGENTEVTTEETTENNAEEDDDNSGN